MRLGEELGLSGQRKTEKSELRGGGFETAKRLLESLILGLFEKGGCSWRKQAEAKMVNQEDGLGKNTSTA